MAATATLDGVATYSCESIDHCNCMSPCMPTMLKSPRLPLRPAHDGNLERGNGGHGAGRSASGKRPIKPSWREEARDRSLWLATPRYHTMAVSNCHAWHHKAFASAIPLYATGSGSPCTRMCVPPFFLLLALLQGRWLARLLPAPQSAPPLARSRAGHWTSAAAKVSWFGRLPRIHEVNLPDCLALEYEDEGGIRWLTALKPECAATPRALMTVGPPPSPPATALILVIIKQLSIPSTRTATSVVPLSWTCAPTPRAVHRTLQPSRSR